MSVPQIRPLENPRTPLMRRYRELQDAEPGVLLLVRVGDFYEAYGHSAELLAETCNITLTGRDDSGGRTAMAGVPYHSVERYLTTLLAAGFKVALAEYPERAA